MEAAAVDTYREQREGKLKAIAAELRELGAWRRANRVENCSTSLSIASRACGGGQPQLLWHQCELPGCPRCSKPRAHAAAEELHEKALAVRARTLLPKGGRLRGRWLHLVLSSATGTGAGQLIDVPTLKANAARLKAAVKELWGWLRTYKRPARAMWCALESSEHGMLHVHALVWLEGRCPRRELPLDPLELKRQWYAASGWGSFVEPDSATGRRVGLKRGEYLGIAEAWRLYHYASAADRKARRKAYDGFGKAFVEVAKYAVKPSANAHLIAVFATALKGKARHWSFGWFRQATVPEEPCPHCGCAGGCGWLVTKAFDVSMVDVWAPFARGLASAWKLPPPTAPPAVRNSA